MEEMTIECEVIFYSPGTFVAEQSTKPIADWDIDLAQRMAQDIVERHGARPYGFRFRRLEVLESTFSDGSPAEARRLLEESPMHYMGARKLTLDDVPDTPENKILRDNMRCNGCDVVESTAGGYRWHAPFSEGDVLLP